MFAVWYPFEWLQEQGAAWNLSFILLVTVLFMLAVGYLLTRHKRF